MAELFSESSDSASASVAAGGRRRASSTTQPVRAQPKSGNKQHKKTVGSQVGCLGGEEVTNEK